MKKVALITGITGQDGAYLAELLLEKGYIVHGIKRRASLFNTDRVDHLYQDPHVDNKNFILHYGDLTDSTNLIRIIQQVQPDEIYNLAAMSHVAVSFETPEYTANADGIGTLRILEAIRILGLEKKTKFYQASTSELYGLVQETPQKETTPFYPRSPYAVAKLYGYWITVNYREAYGIYACNGILFNHESPRRGETFVTRKITRGLSNIAQGLEKCLYMGNMDSLRDWGHAKDYVRMQWMMLQQEQPDDYVIATGKQISVREFITMAAEELGITLIGGHTEVTVGLPRPIIAGTMLGEAAPSETVSTSGATSGDDVILTMGIAIEGTAIIARESKSRLIDAGLSEIEIEKAAGLLDSPGISVVTAARIATATGQVTAMHDPTEGGIAGAVEEMALASNTGITVDADRVNVLPETRRICEALDLDPWGLISSGALLITCRPAGTQNILEALSDDGISATAIGTVTEFAPGSGTGPGNGENQSMRLQRIVGGIAEPLPRFDRDEIARLYGADN